MKLRTLKNRSTSDIYVQPIRGLKIKLVGLGNGIFHVKTPDDKKTGIFGSELNCRIRILQLGLELV